jgi:GTP-binding protein
MMRVNPSVCIVGRSNVGKSALFNKLAETKRALVYDELGVTRDPIVDTSEWKGHTYTVIDTAGFLMSHKKIKNEITEKALVKATQYIQNADLIIFVIDGTVGYTNEDRHIWSYVKKLEIPVIIVINKIDTRVAQEEYEHLVGVLQEDNHIAISAIHSHSINDLQDMIINAISWEQWQNNEIQDKEYFGVALLGKPNVGKSSITNILVKENISIISPIAGTTREAISKQIEENNIEITISDTAGVRKSRSINERIEELMVSNTMKTIEKSHIVIMVFDISEEELYDQDITLIMHAFNNLHRGVLVVWNKIDLVPKEKIKEIVKTKTALYAHFFDIIPQVYFSAKENYEGNIIIDALTKLWKRYKQRFESREIRMILKEAMHKTPLFRIKQELQFQSLSVIKNAPPTILIKTRQKQWFGDAEIAFFKNQLRKKLDLFGVPIVFIVN